MHAVQIILALVTLAVVVYVVLGLRGLRAHLTSTRNDLAAAQNELAACIWTLRQVAEATRAEVREVDRMVRR